MTNPTAAGAAPTPPPAPARNRRQIIAWGMWDWGAASFHAVIVTFIFSVYLVSQAGVHMCPDVVEAIEAARQAGETLTESDKECAAASSALGWALGLAGLIIAVLAPVTGQRADVGGARRRSLALYTFATVATMAALFFVKPELSFFYLGLVLLGLGSIFMVIGEVSYNAMIRQISTPDNIGRVSGFGWSMGYFGGILLLLICYFGFVADGAFFGAPTDAGFNIRLIAVVCAVWLAVFALPVLFAVPELDVGADAKRPSWADGYRKLFRDVRTLWRTDRHTVYFLLASALFRDGLSAIFSFGAILAVQVYDFDAGGVLIFGVAANVVAALGAVAAGFFDDRIGPKQVIIFSLVGMIIAGGILGFLSGSGAFWLLGLILCLFVGPAQSSARTYLARMTPPGKEGEMFGLYATTGRAVSFLAPTLFGLFVAVFNASRAGIAGIIVVLLLGLVALLPVRKPVDTLLQ